MPLANKVLNRESTPRESLASLVTAFTPSDSRSVVFEGSCMRNWIVVEELTRAVPHESECQKAEQREHWRAPLIQCGRPHRASLVGSWRIELSRLSERKRQQQHVCDIGG